MTALKPSSRERVMTHFHAEKRLVRRAYEMRVELRAAQVSAKTQPNNALKRTSASEGDLPSESRATRHSKDKPSA